jgi:ABC-type sugar transport system ATPase subunit
MIYVTHDQTEAMTLADRIVVMHAGVVQQVGTPVELFRAPANVFVPGFIGSPKMNMLRGRAADGRVEIDGADALPSKRARSATSSSGSGRTTSKSTTIPPKT